MGKQVQPDKKVWRYRVGGWVHLLGSVGVQQVLRYMGPLYIDSFISKVQRNSEEPEEKELKKRRARLVSRMCEEREASRGRAKVRSKYWKINSVGQLQIETMGQPALLGL